MIQFTVHNKCFSGLKLEAEVTSVIVLSKFCHFSPKVTKVATTYYNRLEKKAIEMRRHNSNNMCGKCDGWGYDLYFCDVLSGKKK